MLVRVCRGAHRLEAVGRLDAVADGDVGDGDGRAVFGEEGGACGVAAAASGEAAPLEAAAVVIGAFEAAAVVTGGGIVRIIAAEVELAVVVQGARVGALRLAVSVAVSVARPEFVHLRVQALLAQRSVHLVFV